MNTVKVVDATLKVDTPRGPVWHRYQGDGYGEHADGGPFDGTGVGRGWPLLTGERAHYELAAGRRDTAKALAQAMEALAARVACNAVLLRDGKESSVAVEQIVPGDIVSLSAGALIPPTVSCCKRAIAHTLSRAREDKADLAFTGFPAVSRSTQAGMTETLKALARDGINVKVITRDNCYVTTHLAEVGLPPPH